MLLPLLGIAFDLDGTLAPSKQPTPQEIAEALRRISTRLDLAIITGGTFEQVRMQVAHGVDKVGGFYRPVHVFPTSGAAYFRLNTATNFRLIFEHSLSLPERAKIRSVIEDSARQLGLWELRTWGDIIEDRGTQVTFSALGQQAPLDKKLGWDPDGEKRNLLCATIAERLPGFDVRTGGSTSIDVVRKNIDKAYAMSVFLKNIGAHEKEVAFVGDQLEPGGNDYCVKAKGYYTVTVGSPEDTLQFLNSLQCIPEPNS